MDLKFVDLDRRGVCPGMNDDSFCNATITDCSPHRNIEMGNHCFPNNTEGIANGTCDKSTSHCWVNAW